MNNDKMDELSMDLEAANRERLAAVFPECFSEGKLDLEKLLALCGNYTADDFEKYEFRWKGKADCLKLAQKRSSATLRPCREESVDFDTTQNLYLEGDNLEVLKLLQTAYYRQVKMIYIDPPYNTGHDFVYADDFADPLAKYREVTQQTTKSNPETMGRYHTNWLNMMYPRLRLASNLLRDDGVIFISIDDNEVDNLKKLCNEVFGEENSLGEFIWKSRQNVDSRNKSGLSIDHEYVLIYCKSLECSSLLGKKISEDKYSNPDNDPRGPWMSNSILGLANAFQRPNLHYVIEDPKTGHKFNCPPDTGWRFSKETMAQKISEGRIVFPADEGGRPREKKFLNELSSQYTGMSSLLPESVGFTFNGSREVRDLFDGKYFDFPKPVDLLKCLVSQGTDKEGDIVLDFFSGSGTLAHAVMALNAEDGGSRRFIVVQLPEICPEDSDAFKAGYKNLCEIGKERIRRAARKIKEENPLFAGDMGFKVFKLDSSNLKLWDGSPLTQDDLLTLSERLNDMIDRVKPDRSDEDVIAEIMLKLGVPLTEEVSRQELDGHTFYIVGRENLLLLCLQDQLSTDDLEKLADLAPGIMVLSESALADDSAMSNAHYILKNRGIELKLI